MRTCLHALGTEQRPLAVLVLRGMMRCPHAPTLANVSNIQTPAYSPGTPTLAYSPDTGGETGRDTTDDDKRRQQTDDVNPQRPMMTSMTMTNDNRQRPTADNNRR